MSRKKLLYIAALPIDFNSLDGIAKKIMDQVMALSHYLDVEIIYYFDNCVRIFDYRLKFEKNIGVGHSKLDVLKTARKYILENHFDCSYIRYPRSDFLFIRLIKCMNKLKMDVVCEIPTYPYDIGGLGSFKMAVIHFLDLIFSKKLKKYINKIVTYSDDDFIFGISTIKTINGINFEVVKKRQTPSFYEKTSEITIIAVSSMFKVHGFDRLIRGIHEYYESGGSRCIKLLLVGDGSERIKYQKMVDEFCLDKTVCFCGNQFGEALDSLYSNTLVGINSLAIHREGLKKESTLKTKEYAAKGLPIVSSSFVDAFSDEGNDKYVMRVEPNEDSIDVAKLIDFIDCLYLKKNINDLAEKIREDAKTICDVNVTMKPIVDYFLRPIK